MKIGPSIESHVADPSLRGAARNTSAPAATASAAAPTGDAVDVSAAGAQMALAGGSPDFDSAKVDAIRQAIRDGRFSVNPGAIADRLIADATSLLAPRATRTQ